MNDEIKEKLKLIDVFFNKASACDLDEVYHAVIDTITNLQQENEVLENEKDMFYKVSQERLNKWLSLNDENNKLVEIIKDYKSRCEKIQKIINTEKKLMGYAIYDSCLLLIEEALNGRSDE